MIAKKIRIFILVLLALSVGSVHAFYASASTPSNITNSLGRIMVKSGAADVSFGAGSGIRSAIPAVVNVGGRAISLPVAYTYASDAALVAARYSYANPALIIGLGAASLAYGYYKANNYQVINGQWAKVLPAHGTQYAFCDGCWASTVDAAGARMNGRDAGNGLTYSYDSAVGTYAKFNLKNAQDENAGVVYLNAVTRTEETETITPASEVDFTRDMSAMPLPAGVPQELGIPLPVDEPILNPSPGDDPQSQPLRVPQSDPQLVPNSDPPQWKTSVVDIKPSSIASDPWRVDVVSKDFLSSTSAPIIDPVPIPETPASGTSTQEKEPGLCELFPDILACAKLGEAPAPETLQKETYAVTVVAAAFASSAGCPAPVPFSVFGRSYSISYQPLCDRLADIKFLFIAIGAFIAAYVLADSFRV